MMPPGAALRFVEAETTAASLQTLRAYLQAYGRPVAVYSDRHSIFRVNLPDCEGQRTQYTRVLETLDIQPIHAHTPQAKGRVERAHQTLQDRLVKALRLQGIDTLEQANALLPAFQQEYSALRAPPTPPWMRTVPWNMERRSWTCCARTMSAGRYRSS